MKLVLLDLDDAATIRALAREIAEALKANGAAPAPLPLPPQQGAAPFVTRAQAVAMGVELRALVHAEKKGTLPAFKPGRAVVYRVEDVVALVERARVAPQQERAASAEVLPLDPFERAIVRAARRPGR